MRSVIAAVVLIFCSSVASADIVYNVNRTVGAGSVVGTIETDGTLGLLNSGNIVDWTFTLTSASLLDGPSYVITKSTALQTAEAGGFFSATSNELFFDFSGLANTGYVIFQGINGNF